MGRNFTCHDFAAIKNWGGKKWIVAVPTPSSSKEDILFQVTPLDLVTQILGGLEPNSILLVTDDHFKAERMANILIAMKNAKGSFDILDLARVLNVETTVVDGEVVIKTGFYPDKAKEDK